MNKPEQNAESILFLPVLPLKNVIALPKSIIPVIVGREISIKAVEHALKATKEIFVTAQKHPHIENPTINDLFSYGTRAVILQVAKLPNGTLKILIEGIARSKIVSIDESITDFFAVHAEDQHSTGVLTAAESKALWRGLNTLFKEYASLNDKISQDVLNILHDLEDLDYLTDTIAVQVQLDFEEKQEILEISNLKERAMKLSALLKNEIEILRAEESIKKRISSQIEKHQKDYYLNEQIRAIQKELGREDAQQEIDTYKDKAKKLKISPEAKEKIEYECKRLEQMQPSSPEAAISRNYIETLLALPWHKTSKDNVSIKDAEALLEKSHAGMKKPKERIIEFLAAKKFAKEQLTRSPIICLAGPPGVGKTSLAQSIAHALGRPMIRISLGGLRDEAEIRGHRRTYIGSMPGKIIQAMKKAHVINPVIVLDEIDKMSMDFRGDPSSAMLEVLDPEQNKSFSDHFLEIGYDLSQAMFVATANVIDNIPHPLLDRMEIVSLAGYTENEKLQIAQKFLLPKVLTEHGLKKTEVVVSPEILKKVIDGYTKEAGVRQIERLIAKIVRKSIQMRLEDSKLKKITITEEMITQWLGAQKFNNNIKKSEERIGVATGLAWTEVGGELLEIEVSVLKGKGALTLTGQLGEVMQESAHAALSYIRSRAHDFGLKEEFYSDSDIHIHLPEGSIPKDGPSAGIGLVVAITSALTKTPIAREVAMTGEVTLRGRVLPVGGLKEKLLAAARFGIKKVIVPLENKNDIQEFISELPSDLLMIYADHMDQVLEHALTKKLAPAPKKKSVKKKPSSKTTKKVKVVK
jgi:ATP-dependent Lon protease